MITELPLYNKILILLIDFIGVWLAIIVYNNNPKGKLNKVFLGMIASMFFWVNFAYLARLIGRQQSYWSLICLKIAWFATPFLFVFLYFLVLYYLKKESKYRILSLAILFGGIILSLLTAFTNLIVENIEFIGTDLTIIYGKGVFLFLGIGVFLICAPLYLLFEEYVRCLPKERIRIEYLLIGIFIFYLANIIFNIVFPVVFKVVYLYWMGDYSSIVLLGFIAYAIVRRDLFGIRVILTTLLVGAIAILLALDIFVFTTELISRLYKGLTLIIFIYFGYLLIRSVLREIESKERIKRAYDMEKKALKQTEALTEAKTQFLMATQHHLRTPLTSMIGYLDLIFGGTYGKVPVKIKQALLKFESSTKRLMRVVNELLDISQFQLGKEVVSLQPGTDVLPILKEVIEELQFEVEYRNLYLKFQKIGKIPKIKADSEKLKVALFNIVDNAIKYTRKGGVTVNVKRKEESLLIAIKDTGIGIAKGEAGKLFKEAFERGKTAKKVHDYGRGIGLYITGHIIKAHKGRIWAESEGSDKGSTFFIELPVK